MVDQYYYPDNRNIKNTLTVNLNTHRQYHHNFLHDFSNPLSQTTIQPLWDTFYMVVGISTV